MTVNMSNSESRKREAHVYDSPEGANEPTPDPLRAALQGLADEFDTRAQAVKAESDGIYCAYANARDMAARILAAHPEPEREAAPFAPAEVGSPEEAELMERLATTIRPGDRVTVRLNSTDILTGKVYEADDPSRRRALFVNTTLLRYGNGYPGYYMLLDHTPVAHQDTEREAAGFERAVDLASTVFGWQHLARYSGQTADWLDQTLRAIVRSARGDIPDFPVPPAPETDEAAATLAEVEKLFRGTFFGDFGGHDWRGGDATVQEFARDLGRLLHDYRKQADR